MHPPHLSSLPFVLPRYAACAALHSFPTRRSSDLFPAVSRSGMAIRSFKLPRLENPKPKCLMVAREKGILSPDNHQALDRKSTRLNSSHITISYAVFCLKKKHTNTNNTLESPDPTA